MNYKESEVLLSIDLAGKQAVRGCYTHYHRVDKDGKDVHGLKTDRAPAFTACKKSVRLSNEFVKAALAEPLNMGKKHWMVLPQKKRIMIHVAHYIKSTCPEHRGYSVEIL